MSIIATVSLLVTFGIGVGGILYEPVHKETRALTRWGSTLLALYLLAAVVGGLQIYSDEREKTREETRIAEAEEKKEKIEADERERKREVEEKQSELLEQLNIAQLSSWQKGNDGFFLAQYNGATQSTILPQNMVRAVDEFVTVGLTIVHSTVGGKGTGYQGDPQHKLWPGYKEYSTIIPWPKGLDKNVVGFGTDSSYSLRNIWVKPIDPDAEGRFHNLELRILPIHPDATLKRTTENRQADVKIFALVPKRKS